MEREKGSHVEGPRVVTETGREGIVIGWRESNLEVQVQFDDGEIAWIPTEKARDVREIAKTGGIPRELGS